MTRRHLRIFIVLSVASLVFASSGLAQKNGGPLLGDALAITPAPIVNFGDVVTGAGPVFRLIYLVNLGEDPLLVDLPSQMGAFTIPYDHGPTLVLGGQSMSVQIRYEPPHNALDYVEIFPCEDSETVLTIRGRGVPEVECGFSDLEVDFGSAEIGSPITAAVLVYNDSSEHESLSINGQCNAFSVLGPTALGLDPGEVGQYLVEFDPMYAGEYVGSFYGKFGANLWLRGVGEATAPKGPGNASAQPVSTRFSMSIAPNPADRPSVVRYAYVGDVPIDARLRIVDSRGRLVRSEPLVVRPGAHVWEWNRLDGDGQPVASGVYFVELQTRGSSVRQKVTVIR